MGGEVGGAADGAVDDVVEDEDACRLADALYCRLIEYASPDEEEAEDGAVEAEDGARGSGADGLRMDQDADDAATEAGEEVDDQVAGASEDGFDEWADLVEDVHVEGDVDDAEVEEGGGEETPVLLSADGVGVGVAAPVEDVLWGGVGGGEAARDHGQVDEDVDRDQGVGDGVGVGGAALLGEGFGDCGVIHVSPVLSGTRVHSVFA